jgi:hypothetical protein
MNVPQVLQALKGVLQMAGDKIVCLPNKSLRGR